MTSDTPSGGSSIGIDYDALGRPAMTNVNGASYTEFVYAPDGSKLALMNGQTLYKARVPLPGGGRAIYDPTGLVRYWHSDWQGTMRLVSNPSSPTYYWSGAYAPYGETYALGSNPFVTDFASLMGDTSGELDDATYREYNPTEGRWMSPDPAGLAAVDLTNPQSLNRYAYVMNNPTTLRDPLGTCPNPPPGYTLVQASTCTFKPPVCNGMVCADQYYGGQLFEGAGSQAETGVICVTHGIAGYCGQGALESFMSPTGSDEFDATDLSSGVYWSAPSGSLQCNGGGRCSTSTGSLAFSDALWGEANGTSNELEGTVAKQEQPGSMNSLQALYDAVTGDYIFVPGTPSAATQGPGETALGPVIPVTWKLSSTGQSFGVTITGPNQWYPVPGVGP